MSKPVSFSFLAAGPRFSFEIRDEFLDLPTISTPLRNGVGGRSFDFVPTARDTVWSSSWRDECKSLGTLESGDGRNVELLQRLDPPPIWWLAWTLNTGALYTHLREEDGQGLGQVVVDSISIVEEEAVTPFLLLEPPMTLGISARAGYQERATFLSSAESPTAAVTFQRPGSGSYTRSSRSGGLDLCGTQIWDHLRDGDSSKSSESRRGSSAIDARRRFAYGVLTPTSVLRLAATHQARHLPDHDVSCRERVRGAVRPSPRLISRLTHTTPRRSYF
jgi:hypothetical protein